MLRRPVESAQYVSIKYTERLAEAGIEPSVGSVGDSYDNALAETINGLYKAEVIHRRGPWRSFEAVEYATLEWVDWLFNRMPGVKPCWRQTEGPARRGIARADSLAFPSDQILRRLRPCAGSGVVSAVGKSRRIMVFAGMAFLCSTRSIQGTASSLNGMARPTSAAGTSRASVMSALEWWTCEVRVTPELPPTC